MWASYNIAQTGPLEEVKIFCYAQDFMGGILEEK